MRKADSSSPLSFAQAPAFLQVCRANSDLQPLTDRIPRLEFSEFFVELSRGMNAHTSVLFYIRWRVQRVSARHRTCDDRSTVLSPSDFFRCTRPLGYTRLLGYTRHSTLFRVPLLAHRELPSIFSQTACRSLEFSRCHRIMSTSVYTLDVTPAVRVVSSRLLTALPRTLADFRRNLHVTRAALESSRLALGLCPRIDI